MTRILIVGWVLVFMAAGRGGEWLNWRGPMRNGISAEKGLLEVWPESGPKVLWKGEVGVGFSSCVVGEGRVVTAGNRENRDVLTCFDAVSGKVLWQYGYDSDLGDKYFEGGTTGTPTLDGGKVYFLGRWGDLVCLEAATGKVVWMKNVQKETGARVPSWGFGGSPVVEGPLLLLNVGEGGLALEKATGAIRWQSAPKEAGYSTPYLFKQGGQELVLLGSGQSYVAVEMATGKERWRVRWLTQYGVNAADPIVDGGMVFLSTGYGKGCGVYKLGEGEPELVWKSKVMRNQCNPSVLVGGHLYGVDGDTTEKAVLKCVEMATGTEKWVEAGIGSGSVTVVDGKLLVLSDKGELILAPVSSAGFKPVSRGQVLGGKCWTVPVVSGGRVYCRNSRGDLVCVDLRAGK